MKNKKSLLCLDLGTKTGWAILNNCKITSGSVNFKIYKNEKKEKVFFNFQNWLNSIKNNVQKVYYEEVVAHKGVYASHAYGGFKATLTNFCENNNIIYEGVPVGTIKKYITGKGNANKKAVIKAIIKKGFKPADDNEADALALLEFINYKYNQDLET